MKLPRTGCQTCKTRRIKRCEKSRRTCLQTISSAKPACFSIHFENQYASGASKRPRGPRPALKSRAASNGVPSLVLQPPPLDLHSLALVNYLHRHLQTLGGLPSILKGVPDSLPAWISTPTSPMVDLAISSMALIVFANTQMHPPAATDASQKYQQLLPIVQGTIPSLDEKNIDACLVAIFLMSRYEDAVHRPNRPDSKSPLAMCSPSFSHHDGALAILKVWKDRLSYKSPATDIIKHTRRGVIRSAFLRSLALPRWILEGSIFGENGLELDVDRIVVRITNVRHHLSTLVQQKFCLQTTSYELASRAEELNEKARDIDQAMEDWLTQIPSHWQHTQYALSSPLPLPRRHFYSSSIYSYSTLAYAIFWSHYFATRMLIESTRLRILKLLHPSSNGCAHNQHLECQSHMRLTANNLASSIPFCLERFKVAESPDPLSHQDSVKLTESQEINPRMANLMVWPLTIASSLEGVDAEQKLWFRTELAHVGRIVGAGVLECADTDEWLEL